MHHAHYFVVDNLAAFIAELHAMHYVRMPPSNGEGWIFYEKTLSNAVTKYYGYKPPPPGEIPVEIRVTYQLLGEGRQLKRLTNQLKYLSSRFRQSLPIWKTKRPAAPSIRQSRQHAIKQFITKHRELIACYRYQGESAASEGNTSFNLHVGATPKERAACFEFVKALLEAYTPQGLYRGRRQVDRPRLQRDGWIKRYASLHRRRGWGALDILREIQKELREGTWNERSKLQYNLATNTIGRIAGIKAAVHHHQFQ